MKFLAINSLFVAAALWVGLPCVVLGDEATKQQFASEAPIAWEKARNLSSEHEFTITEKKSSVDAGTEMSGKLISTIRRLADASSEDAKREPGSGENEGIHYVTIVNSDYVAIVGQEEGRNWLEILHTNGSLQYQELTNKQLCKSLPAFSFFSNYLPYMIVGFPEYTKNRPEQFSLVVDDAEVISSGPHKGFVRVFFNLCPKTDTTIVSSSDKDRLEIVFDTNRNWSILETSQLLDNRDGSFGKQVSKCLFTENEQSCQPFKVIETFEVYTADQTLFKEQKESEISPLVFSGASANDFRLTAYGLPEPSPSRKSRRWIVIAVLTCLSGVLLWRSTSAAFQLNFRISRFGDSHR